MRCNLVLMNIVYKDYRKETPESKRMIIKNQHEETNQIATF